MTDVRHEHAIDRSAPVEDEHSKLEILQVSKTYRTRKGETVALQPTDLAIAAGEFVAVVGPSGCGKSTLMMLAAGLEPPTAGEILVDGAPAGPPGPKRSVVFQRFALFPSETVRQNIEFGLKVARLGKQERNERVAAQLELMGLEQFADSYPHELSGGMQQRVAIARSLAVRPEILFMDEPFGALDAQTRTLMQEEVSKLHQREHYTVMFITHSVEEAVYLADRVVVMSRRPGKIKAEIRIPRDTPWRGGDIEEAMSHADFGQYRRDIWELVREELVRS